MLERLSFKTEFKNMEECKNSAVLAISFSFLFVLLSIISSHFYSLAYTLGIGAMIYQIYSIYLLHEIIRKKINWGKYFAFFLLLLVLATAAMMVYKFDRIKIRENPMGVAIGFVIVLAPVFFWEEISRKARKYTKFLVFFLFVFLLTPAYSQNETNETGTLEKIGSALDFGKTIIKYASDIMGFFGNIQEGIRGLFGLDPSQSQVVYIIILLAMVYLLFRAMKWVVKWVILILFVWVALQVLGIL